MSNEGFCPTGCIGGMKMPKRMAGCAASMPFHA
jgi:hypothetical protein